MVAVERIHRHCNYLGVPIAPRSLLDERNKARESAAAATVQESGNSARGISLTTDGVDKIADVPTPPNKEVMDVCRLFPLSPHDLAEYVALNASWGMPSCHYLEPRGNNSNTTPPRTNLIAINL